MRQPATQRGLGLIELAFATAIGAFLLAAINSLVKLGLDAQTTVRASNELSYQARYALERMSDQARSTAPTALITPTAGTTGNWFAPTMYCRNAGSQLIETNTADTGCTGTGVIANNVAVFSALLPTGMGARDRPTAVLSLNMVQGNTLASLSSSVRLGGGTQ